MIEVAINGARTPAEHPAIPRTSEELAVAVRTSVDAGAHVAHVHAYEANGRETLAAEPCAGALRAIRAACSGVPISLTTSAAIEPDPKRRFELIAAWTELPELVTANMGEAGIAELCDALVRRGVGIEAGLLSLEDAETFARSGLADRCVRVLVEPLDADPCEAVAHAGRMEDVLARAGIALPQVHHGDGIASWSVNAHGAARGHGIRTGLEDTTVLADGALAPDNAACVRAAVELSGLDKSMEV
jgi:uncharacterized protein (DUF849 family)